MLSDKRIKELERAEAKLNALEAGGVDNWDGYDSSLEHFRKTIELEEKIDVLMEDIEVALLEGAYEPSERGAGFTARDESRKNATELLKRFLSESKDER
jgi:uncharacterized protein Yka (UPF0111/DUF47 family)